MPAEIDLGPLKARTKREVERFAASHPRSGELRDAAADSLLSGVPMNWMTRWPGAFPVVFDTAAGASLTDVDGISYVDFCLGDTGAMAGHSPAPTVAAAAKQLERGITTMLPSEDAGPVGAELGRRFGLRHWQFTLTATDANRFAIRLCREITGRPKILVFNHCYHGSVDETFAEFTAVAENAKAETLVKLRDIHARAGEHEGEQAKAITQRAELEGL